MSHFEANRLQREAISAERPSFCRNAKRRKKKSKSFCQNVWSKGTEMFFWSPTTACGHMVQKRPWKVMWFSHIIYFLSDYQRLCKQLPKLIKLQKCYSMPSCLMNVDKNYGQKWPPEGVSVHTNKQFPVLFCIFYLWRGIACPLDELSVRQYTICENHTTVHGLLIHTL